MNFNLTLKCSKCSTELEARQYGCHLEVEPCAKCAKPEPPVYTFNTMATAIDAIADLMTRRLEVEVTYYKLNGDRRTLQGTFLTWVQNRRGCYENALFSDGKSIKSLRLAGLHLIVLDDETEYRFW